MKYPRTPHLAGSRLQPGDSTSGQVSLAEITGGDLIFEEKIDGANCAVSFDAGRRLMLQSRGHVLHGGASEAQFALFKAWAHAQEPMFRDLLEGRFVLFGEWCFAKHTVFYDALPHFFHEFDIYDRNREVFLSTAARQRMLDGTPIVSVPVLHHGHLPKGTSPRRLIGRSLYKSHHWHDALEDAAAIAGLDVARVLAETDASDLAEGLYVKHEDGDRVIGRYKYVRADFCQAILDSGSHWRERPILPNRLAPGIDLFAGGTS
ncbi:MAG: DNA ligase [Alphaproteobacteria bacterium]|nr:DNA ligase [Alphaproteobacteria bacterium]